MFGNLKDTTFQAWFPFHWNAPVARNKVELKYTLIAYNYFVYILFTKLKLADLDFKRSQQEICAFLKKGK